MSTVTLTAGPFQGSRRSVRSSRPAVVHRSAAARSSRPVAATSVRLTRRGRLLLGLVVLAVAVVTAVLSTGGGSASAGVSGRGGEVAVQQVTVRPGETLWAIATREAPGVDPRATVAELVDLNDLPGAAVQAGQVLLLPR